jgi:hypothetical protein
MRTPERYIMRPQVVVREVDANPLPELVQHLIDTRLCMGVELAASLVDQQIIRHLHIGIFCLGLGNLSVPPYSYLFEYDMGLRVPGNLAILASLRPCRG